MNYSTLSTIYSPKVVCLINNIRCKATRFTLCFLFFNLLINFHVFATDYHVGPGQSLTSISQVPWATLEAGDRVYIHWKATPYKEKWVVNRQGTLTNPIEIIGISNAQGQQPVIDGNNAITVDGVNFWNESRGIIKIGGSNVPQDGLPAYITIENLEIKSARPPYQFTNDNGQTETYANNAAAIYVEKAAHLIIRNCTLHDSGNGLFIGEHNGLTENILIEKNYIYNNGIEGSYYQHNTYTSAINITYQFNRLGPLRTGAGGNNLKDRSAGLLIRNNWIEGGNRQLDLVDATGSTVLLNHPKYSTTHVYSNILIEPDGAGNSQIMHYGGDSGHTNDYRKGDLYFYNNTVISTRTGNTTLVRLSTNDETAHVFNNLIYTIASGEYFAMIAGHGTFNMNHNWLKPNWQHCFCSPDGVVIDLGNNISGADPFFDDFDNQIFSLQEISPLINQGGIIPSLLLPDYNVSFEYVKHQESVSRPVSGNLDIGAFEFDEQMSTEALDKEYSLKIFPNPVTDILHFTCENRFIKSYKIYDLLGQVVLSGTLKDARMIDVSSLSKGVYLLQLNSKSKNIGIKFLVGSF